jgi:hypothetical protein
MLAFNVEPVVLHDAKLHVLLTVNRPTAFGHGENGSFLRTRYLHQEPPARHRYGWRRRVQPGTTRRLETLRAGFGYNPGYNQPTEIDHSEHMIKRKEPQVFYLQLFTSARATGLEPATTGSTVRYSNQLSYAPRPRKLVVTIEVPAKLSKGPMGDFRCRRG